MSKRSLFTVLATLLLFIAASAEVSAQVSFGSSELFNKGWKFVLGDNPESSSPAFDDTSWQEVNVPHDWSVSMPTSRDKYSCTGWLPGGIGWYRKSFELGKEPGERYYLYFEGVYNRSTVYLNGRELGSRPNGYISFMYEITDCLAHGGPNTLAVRVDHSREADSRWYTGSGIYRNVWLVKAPDRHFAQWGLSYSLSDLDADRAVLSVSSGIEPSRTSCGKGNMKVRFAMYDASGNCVAEKMVKPSGNMASAELEIPHPELWSVDSPVLYSLESELILKGEVVDRAATRAGIRESVFDPDRGYFLNGKNMKLKGVCLHHDAGVLGAAVPAEVWRRRLMALKSIGVNAVRTSHNPQSPAFYDICDEIGLLVMDEAFDEWRYPKRKWLEGWNVGKPGFEGSYDFFEEWAEKDITDMVRRDRNHPSIIMWSIGNEVDYPNDPYTHPVLAGEYREKDPATGVIFWDLDYEPGELTVRAYRERGASAEASETLYTCGEAYALKAYLIEDESVVTSGDVLGHIVVEVVDKDGRRDRGASVPVTCETGGGAVMVGMESSDNSDMSEQNDNVCNTFDGRLLVYARFDKSMHNVLKFKASSLASPECAVTVH
ncbi:MAG: glycoside hydrolase family 2 TIM barrel-domain containing protein [Candidatus Cryptobacteroides sp.]